MLTRLRFLAIGQRFEYKKTIFEKISAGKVKSVYVSSNYKKDEEILLPPNTWVSYKKPVTPKRVGQLKLF